MDYQIDSRHRSQEVRVGRDDTEVARFVKAGLLVHNLKGEVDAVAFQMKLPSPWNGFRYQLLQGDRVVASARRQARMHAFEPDRPNHRHRLVAFDLDVSGRTLTLTPLDRHGLVFRIEEGGAECGRLANRNFDDQVGGDWESDLTAPADWSVALAAWVAWLAREGRSRMSS